MEKDLKKEGYSKEEEYFHKLNQQLIQKMKQEQGGKKPSVAGEPSCGKEAEG